MKTYVAVAILLASTGVQKCCPGPGGSTESSPTSSQPPDDDDDDDDDDDPPTPGPTRAVMLNKACWAVGVLKDNEEDCRPMPGWRAVGDRMFRNGTHALDKTRTPGAPLPERLAQFCFYKWVGGLEDPKVSKLERGVFTASVDCPSVIPQGPPSSDVPANELSVALLKHAGRPPSSRIELRDKVMVAVVDSGSDEGLVADDDHGAGVRRIIQATTCRGDECPVQVRRALALPIHKDGSISDPAGGEYGTRAHLAIGIVEAVEAWRATVNESTPAKRLVINVSAGWVPSSEDPTNELGPWDGDERTQNLIDYLDKPDNRYDDQAAVEAVHIALLYASCNGALIVTAAGNRRAGSCDDTPVAPAIWARYSAPTPAECSQMLRFALPEGIRLPPEPAEALAAAPLVLPVSGIEPDGRSILATRPGTVTKLVAPGFFGSGGGPTPPMTGSSTSAAMVSGAAAILWSRERNLTVRQVTDRLYNDGVPTALKIELNQHPPPVPQMSRRLCIAELIGDPAATKHCADERGKESYADVPDYPDDVVVDAPDPESTGEEDCDPCPTSGRSRNQERPRCVRPPPEGPYGADDLAGPQPNTPICIDCPIKATGQTTTATLELHNDYLAPGVTLVEGHLSIWENWAHDSYDLSQYIDLSQTGALATGSRVRIDDLPEHPGLSAAEVEFLVDDGQDQYWRSSSLRVLP